MQGGARARDAWARGVGAWRAARSGAAALTHDFLVHELLELWPALARHALSLWCVPEGAVHNVFLLLEMLSLEMLPLPTAFGKQQGGSGVGERARPFAVGRELTARWVGCACVCVRAQEQHV
jgi:hypothetical protein